MNESLARSREKIESLKSEIRKSIIGQDTAVERLIIALIADGHVLLEGVPGLAKTRMLSTLCAAVGAEMQRVQFTPDLLPSDLVGTEVYRPATGEFETRKGPVFTNLLLADEINRAPAKVQSALLQAMQERAVTIGEVTYQLPVPFMVLATQNPIEQEGTYQLPEAQLDRFLLKLRVGYPSPSEEIAILSMVSQETISLPELSPVCSIADILELRRTAAQLFVGQNIDQYIVSLVQATRDPAGLGLEGMIEWGASPRASIALKAAAKALALIRGQDHVTPDEVKDLAPDVLRHRVLTSYEAEARNVDSDEIIRVLLSNIAVP